MSAIRADLTTHPEARVSPGTASRAGRIPANHAVAVDAPAVVKARSAAIAVPVVSAAASRAAHVPAADAVAIVAADPRAASAASAESGTEH